MRYDDRPLVMLALISIATCIVVPAARWAFSASEVLSLMAVIFFLAAYVNYISNVWRRIITPNLTSWLIAALAGVVNIASYTLIIRGQWHTIALPLAMTLSTFTVVILLLWRGSTVRVDTIDTISLAICVLILAQWWLIGSHEATQLLIQIVSTIAFVVVARGLYDGRGREQWWPWMLATVSYGMATLSVTTKPEWGLVELVYALIGMFGNGAVAIVAATTYDRNTQLLNQQTNSTQAE